MPALYDRIGTGYARHRQPDPRIAAQILAPLDGVDRLVNVGAGSGSYEPAGRVLAAVEPSATMIGQRPAGAAPALRGVAEHLPLADGSADGALVLMTVHHWSDAAAGLAEVRRVTSGPVVVFTLDLGVFDAQWLIEDYLPELAGLDAHLPSPQQIAEVLGGGRVEVVPVPHDCVDGFCHAWWRRPAAYLDPTVRAAISCTARLGDDVVAPAMARLASDLADGAWAARHEDLLHRDELDVGYRLVVATGSTGGDVP